MELTATEADADATVTLRVPELADAREMVRLVRHSGVLDRNSDYAYLLLCQHFDETCVIAKVEGRGVGFVAAYRLPRRTDTLFVWQVAVAAEARGQGLALRMLGDLLRRSTPLGVRFVEATVTPSNTASRALFRSLARRQNADCQVTPLFASEMFSDADAHEPEDLFRIGPFSGPSIHDAST